MKHISDVVFYKSHHYRSLAEITTSAYEQHIKTFLLVNTYINYTGMGKRHYITKTILLGF